MSQRGECSVSIYMPMDLDGTGVQRNPIRFKNSLKKAADLIDSNGAHQLLMPLMRFLEEPDFWRDRMPSLVVFHGPSVTRALRLPVVCEPLVAVEDRFHLKPLIALLAEPGRFYVLAMSQNATWLLEVTRDEVRRIGVEEIPASLNTTLPDDTGQ